MGRVERVLPLVAVQDTETDFQGHLILRNSAMLQQPSLCGDLKPASASQRLASALDGIFGGIRITHG